MALLADLTREEQRTKAMAAIGASIGVSFGLAFVLGPWVAGLFGLHGLFWSTVLLGVAGMAVRIWLVPRPLHHVAHTPASYRQQLRDYVVLAISERFGNFPRNPVIEKSIFTGFVKRWGAQAPAIARCAVEIHGCWWRNAPLSIQRFCQGNDPYFAQVIASRL
jgi:MFS family permease